MTKSIHSEEQSNVSSRSSSLTQINVTRDDCKLSSHSSSTVDIYTPKKNEHSHASVSKSVSSVDSFISEKEKKNLCSRICHCCCCYCKRKKSPEELHRLLKAGERRMSQIPTTQKEFYAPPKKKNAVSGFETGYFTKIDSSCDEKTMKDFRKASKATSNLPDPEIAIKNSNSKKSQMKGAKNVLAGDTNVHEINLMLMSRLNGNLAIDSDTTDEKGEALLTYNRTGKDYTSALLSHLVSQSEYRRMSVHSEQKNSRYRSSFSSAGLELKVETTPVKKGLKPEEMSDSEFLNKLTEVSTFVKSELEKDWSFTQSYIKTLDQYIKLKISQKQKMNMGSERWMVILYTTSEGSDELTNFRCLLTRLILQQHFIAYEERDIALRNMPYKEELQKRLDTANVVAPYVFAYGVTVGNCQVIYALHKMKMMDTIFKNFIMTPDKYAEWLSTRHLGKGSGLKIDVKVSTFPALNILAGLQNEIKLNPEDAAQTKSGKEIVKKARLKWADLSKIIFHQPPLLRFVLLKRTIIMALTLMNDIYQNYLTKKIITQHPAKKRKFSWMR